MAELKRDILEYERSTGQRFLNLRRLFNSAILEGGAKRKRQAARKDSIRGTECLCDAEWEDDDGNTYQHCDTSAPLYDGEHWCMVTAPGQTKGCREKIKKEKFNWGYCKPSSPIVFKTASGADEVINPDPSYLEFLYEYNLDLSHKKITSIPPEIVILIYLHYLHLNNNQLRRFHQRLETWPNWKVWI